MQLVYQHWCDRARSVNRNCFVANTAVERRKLNMGNQASFEVAGVGNLILKLSFDIEIIRKSLVSTPY